MGLSMSRQKRRRLIAEINVVPYIDVMLVLLVIFMITAPLLSQSVQVSLPQASANALPTMKAKPVILSINAEDQLFLNVAPEPKNALSETNATTYAAAYLKLEQKADPAVFVKADRHLPYGKVIRAMTLLQKAGAKTVGLITNPTKS